MIDSFKYDVMLISAVGHTLQMFVYIFLWYLSIKCTVICNSIYQYNYYNKPMTFNFNFDYTSSKVFKCQQDLYVFYLIW